MSDAHEGAGPAPKSASTAASEPAEPSSSRRAAKAAKSGAAKPAAAKPAAAKPAAAKPAAAKPGAAKSGAAKRAKKSTKAKSAPLSERSVSSRPKSSPRKASPASAPPGSSRAKPTRLDPDRILETAQRLERRISERFEGAGLLRVCGQLVALADHAKETCAEIRKPNLRLRVVSYTLIAIMLAGAVGVILISLLEGGSSGDLTWRDVIEVTEAAINDVVLVGAAVYFFISFETRRKRQRVIRALQDLRSLAHLIDVHQLTKTPEMIGREATMTESSPTRTLTRFQMARYLDYCSEMLSLNGKIAALYGEGFDDGDALKAVNDVEELCIGLQRKIWQKMVLLHQGPFSSGV